MKITDPIFSQPTTELIEKLGLNQAGACEIAKQIFQERIQGLRDTNTALPFEKRISYKYEEAPYDEYD